LLTEQPNNEPAKLQGLDAGREESPPSAERPENMQGLGTARDEKRPSVERPEQDQNNNNYG